MNTAIISLIPKKGDLKEICNWRPIFLLNVDYKFLTIVCEEQTCSVAGRTIFSNLFLIREVIQYTNVKNTGAYILSIDQEIAFDKIDRSFLFETLKKLGYAPLFIEFIKTIYIIARTLSYVIMGFSQKHFN